MPAKRRKLGGARPGAGRHTDLTAKVHTRIVKLVRAGNFAETAAAAVGVHTDTLRAWLRRGAKEAKTKPNSPYARFVDDVVEAAAEAECRDIEDIGKIGREGIWQALAWRQERKNFQRWGRRERHELAAVVHQSETSPFEGRDEDELGYYAEHGHFPEEAPEGQEGAPGGEAKG